MKDIQFNIKQQGKPAINAVGERVRQGSLVVIDIDMHSKYCRVAGSSGNSVLIEAHDGALDLTENDDPLTWVEFPDYEGWSFVASSCGRYTITVVLQNEVL